MRYIVPDRYSAGQLVKAYRFFREHPEHTWVCSSMAWTGHENSAQRFFDWFYEKLTEKINRVFVYTGKGNRAKRREARLRDYTAECKWCGQKTGKMTKQFCDASCARSYYL